MNTFSKIACASNDAMDYFGNMSFSKVQIDCISESQ